MHLRSLTPEALRELWPELELDEAMARRVTRRVTGEDRDDLDDLRGVAKWKTALLRGRGRLDRLEIVDRRASAVDPFVKYLFRSPLGGSFEAVRIPLEQPRWSACVSSQVGCALACDFCQTGRLGLTRNLEPWEIVEQVLTIRRESPERPLTGVVFQGQGEPFHNYDNVIRAAEILRHPCGGQIRGDRMTISTVGMLPMIDRYTDEGHPYRLILSLTSAFDGKRERLMPIGRTWSVRELAAAMIRHHRARRDVVHLAWVLMAGENAQPEEAREIRRVFGDVQIRVHVVDVNDTTGRYRRAGDAERKAFLSALAAERIAFVRRYSGGPDIHAACGMLASEVAGGVAIPA